jgi:hypothetical protein
MKVRRSLVIVACWVERGPPALRAALRHLGSASTRSRARRGLDTALSRLRGCAQLVVQRIGGQAEGAVLLTGCVLVAAASTAAIAIIAGQLGSGPGELLELAGALAVGVFAVGATVWLLRVRAGATAPLELRALTASVLHRLEPRHQRGRALRVLRAACDPRCLLPSQRLLRDCIEQLARRARKEIVHRPLRHLPVLGSALRVLSVCEDTLDSGRFVREFAFTALELYSEAA